VLAVEAMRVEMEKLVMDSGALAKFGEMLSQITKVMAEGLKELGGAVTGDTTKGAAIGSGIGQAVGTGLGSAGGGLAGRYIGGALGAAGGLPGMLIGGALGSVLGDYLGGKIGEAISGLLGSGKALGGIAAGPDSGYLEKLHGVEAVVPLPDGRSIPVTMDSSGDSAMLNLMKEQVELFKNMLDSLRNSEDLQDRMLSNSY
jgi:outer membrane lipoprotein SlyB